MTASQHMIMANRLRFRAMVDGPAAGDMVILLHGFPEGAESWSRQVDALARGGFLAVAPDLRGYGLSDAPEGVENYSIDRLAEDVRALITSFGRSAAHVAGHDWGAMVAWYFAGKHPQLTKTLTALSVPHPAALAAASRDDADQQERSRYVGLFLMEGKAEQVLAADGFLRFRKMFRSGAGGDAVPEKVIDHFVRSVSRPGRLTAALNYYRANLGGGAAWESLAEIGPITMPTALLWGDQDPALGRSAAEATAQYVDGEYRFEVLEGAGHWLQFERPTEVSQALTTAAK
ncbi:MAG TPA: alpha/beta hydrolase [Candidatus Dormibacteraeota bacterium]|jgi:pimeloyl-ACP methyl ester carboxylesterase